MAETQIFDGAVVGGRFRLGVPLGRGGQGTTFLAYDREQEVKVAVKAFALDRAVDWKQFELFQRECRVLKQLDHPQVPRYLEEIHAEDESTVYLAMEYIPGETLHERVDREGALQEAELWRVLWQVVEILSYLHGRQPAVVHRDIKPRNLIQRPTGEISLVDFGGVRDVFRPDGGSTVVGTFGYMAPEQLHGQATPATDLYALGATLIALGTGMEPEHLPRSGLRIDFDQQLPVSPPLARLLERLTEPEPGRRPRSGATLKQELVAITKGEEEGADGRARPETEMPPEIGVAAGVLMAVLGTVGGVFLSLLEEVLVPLVFALVGVFSGAERRPQLMEKQRRVRAALHSAGPSLKQLSRRGISEFENHRARLPKKRGRPSPRLPRGRRR